MSQIMTPIEIGGVQIKNRVFLPGHTTNFGLNNLPTERILESGFSGLGYCLITTAPDIDLPATKK